MGSSGGGAATLGHSDPGALVRALTQQLRQVGPGVIAQLVVVQFIACDAPLDSAPPTTPAVLWSLDPKRGVLDCAFRGQLSEVNQHARTMDTAIAGQIASGQLDGVVAISTDARAGGVNREALAAAGRLGLPVAGTGGTGLAVAASELGVLLVGNAGGSVATTAHSKSIGITAALAGHWNEGFVPLSLSSASSWHSVVDGPFARKRERLFALPCCMHPQSVCSARFAC